MNIKNLIIRNYRKLPDSFRSKMYTLFLGEILYFFRYPRNPVWYFKGWMVKNKLRSFLPVFENKLGLEIGGGTFMFCHKGFFPVYDYAASIDGCNFSEQTIWEGNISLESYVYNGVELGEQYIVDATNIAVINKKYDFIVSSHCLEHVANPLKAVKGYVDILKDGGIIMFVLPNKQATFDCRRPDTTFSHLLEDFKNNMTEDDLTHLNEIFDYGAMWEKNEEFIKQANENYKYRILHQHVFSKALLIEMFDFFNIKLLYSDEDWQNIYIIGKIK